jgi:hypothetical protein
MSGPIGNMIILALVQKNVTLHNGLAPEEFARGEASYFADEFKLPFLNQSNEIDSPRRVRSWSDIVDGADSVFYAGSSTT